MKYSPRLHATLVVVVEDAVVVVAEVDVTEVFVYVVLVGVVTGVEVGVVTWQS